MRARVTISGKFPPTPAPECQRAARPTSDLSPFLLSQAAFRLYEDAAVADHASLAGQLEALARLFLLLSLLFSHLPGLKDWYARLGVNPDDGGTCKRLLMLALLCLTALASFGLACLGWGSAFGLALTCDRSGAVELVSAEPPESGAGNSDVKS